MRNYLFIFIYVLAIIFFIFFFQNFIHNLSDVDFVSLIKNMAIKNHNDPTIFEKIYHEAQTEELKMQKIITNQFYECIFEHQEQIKTKNDVNTFCGHFINFK